MKNKDEFIIIDWCYNVLFNGKKFKTFEDGWDFIYEEIEDVNDAYDDVFVVNLNDGYIVNNIYKEKDFKIIRKGRK